MTDGTSEANSSAATWYANVVRICKEKGFDEWFYCDQSAWLEHYAEGMTPGEAIQLNYEYLF